MGEDEGLDLGREVEEEGSKAAGLVSPARSAGMWKTYLL